MPNSFYILKDLVNNLDGIYGVVAYSLFQMPDDEMERVKMFKKIIKKRKKIFFACENLTLSNLDDINRLENIWSIKKNQ